MENQSHIDLLLVADIALLIAAMAMLGLIFLLLGDMAPVAMAAMPVAIGWTLAVAALPFLLYLNFLISYLGIDILRAILVVPGKLDRVQDHLAAARQG